MKKAVKNMGMEALCWEIVEIEGAVATCMLLRSAILNAIEQMLLECPYVSESLLALLHKVESEQRERLCMLELEQSRRERGLKVNEPDFSVLSASKPNLDDYTENLAERVQYQ